MSLLKSLLLVECAHFVAGETASEMLDTVNRRFDHKRQYEEERSKIESNAKPHKMQPELETLLDVFKEPAYANLFGAQGRDYSTMYGVHGLHAYIKLVFEEMMEKEKEKERKEKELTAKNTMKTIVKSFLQANIMAGSAKIAAASTMGPVAMVACLGGYIVYRERETAKYTLEQIKQTKISDLMTGDKAQSLGIEIISWMAEKQGEGVINTLALDFNGTK